MTPAPILYAHEPMEAAPLFFGGRLIIRLGYESFEGGQPRLVKQLVDDLPVGTVDAHEDDLVWRRFGGHTWEAPSTDCERSNEAGEQ